MEIAARLTGPVAKFAIRNPTNPVFVAAANSWKLRMWAAVWRVLKKTMDQPIVLWKVMLHVRTW